MKISNEFKEKFLAIPTKVTDGCVFWRGKHNNQGYGNFCFEGCRWLAHRAAYWVAYGYTTRRITHTCKNRICVNPNHLATKSKALLGLEHSVQSRIKE